jgi:hypothetical protein
MFAGEIPVIVGVTTLVLAIADTLTLSAATQATTTAVKGRRLSIEDPTSVYIGRSPAELERRACIFDVGHAYSALRL